MLSEKEEAGDMAKKRVSKQGGNGGGAIPSPKLSKMVYYRNRIKRDYIRLLNYDPAVQTYEECPCTITYHLGELEYTYIPDFSVYGRQGKPRIVVCTSQEHVNDPAYLPKWTAAQLWCEEHGYEFALITEDVLLRYQPLLANLKRLAVHVYRTLPPQAYEYLMQTIIREHQPLTVPAIVQRTPLLDARLTRSYLWHLLAVGELVTDLSKPLHVQTTLISRKGVQQNDLNSSSCGHEI
jgi:hypothetical protein